ncbi:MAG TPA: RNA-binding S4 domain-containing protein [Trichormus sp.]|jgi:ribosome-associated protein
MNDSNETPPAIRLDQFLKFHGIVQSGGQAKHLIQNGDVKVNGEVETRRGRKLQSGDAVEALGQKQIVS